MDQKLLDFAHSGQKKISLKDEFSSIHNSSMTDCETNGCSPSKIILEIGFGYGELLLHHLSYDKHSAVVGIDLFENGIANFLKKLNTEDFTRTRIFKANALDVIENLKHEELDEIIIMFPDPWPKKKQQKRRIITDRFLVSCANLLHSGGRLIMASDCMDYLFNCLKLMEQSGAFKWMDGAKLSAISDHKQTSHPRSTIIINGYELIISEWPSWLPITKYAKRALDFGKSIGYTRWEKRIISS
ncbi:hypothetical protein HYD_4640 [Candidatus Hydrogenosomobacter endosymbioticus]|uniref:tRNA (guanine-N(7)-)-methyltransferase n=2 Tax=Candidatus Hydrogenosomobacter endosymbioticus TaxID=2558174 RepID=A0ABM7V952_9PROT|nr:hypothetical protein HYD_4640 [Candidatus Hydrogenosomobacter endosymbioticus]